MPNSSASRVSAFVVRWRVGLGFLLGAVVFWLASPAPALVALGALIAVVGEVLRIWAAGHLVKSREVTSSGPYRWLAHPLYVGSSIMGVGLAIACGSIVVAVVIAMYVGLVLTTAAKRETAFLRQTFGDDYARYRHGAPSKSSGDRPFSFERAWANREYRAVVGLLLAMLLLALKARANV